MEGLGLAFRLPRRMGDDELVGSLVTAGYAVEVGDNARHRDSYVDTQDGRLYRSGLRLRLRRDLEAWQLLEDGKLVAEQPADGEEIPREGVVGDLVAATAKARKLLPYLDLRVSETALRLLAPGGVEIELSLQRLGYSAPPRPGWKRGPRVLIGERAGHGGESAHLATVLRDLLRLRPLGDPLMVAAASLKVPLPGAPVPQEHRLLPADTMQTAAHKILARQGYKMWANRDGTSADLDMEFLHDLRVASRRARSALRLLVPLYGERLCEALRDELAWIAGVLGEVRDLDVFLARFHFQLARAESTDEVLLDTLQGRRRSGQARVQEALVTDRFATMVATLRAMELPAGASPEQVSWASRPVLEVAPELVKRALQRVRRWQRQAGDDPADQQLHRLRILLKRLRYTCEFFADVLGEPVARAVPPLVELQDTLGDHQDAVVAREALMQHVDAIPVGAPGARERLLCLGALIQVQREIQIAERQRFARLWGKLGKRVKRLRAALQQAELVTLPRGGSLCG